jgi:hypothetical protein
MKGILAFVRSILGPGDTEYGVGWNDAIHEIEEVILDWLWDEGEDA